MISNHLNQIDQRQTFANELATQVAQYLAMGGMIDKPESGAPLKSISQRQQTPNFQGSAARSETSQQIARIRELAKTLNRSDICEKEGITLGVLRGLAKRYAIDFTAPPKKYCAPDKTAPEADAMLVSQVKDCIAKGVNRTRCCEDLRISSTLLYRLIEDYDIDYPKMEPAFR
ncbi:hypothetical protein POF45_28640 [Pseudomonas sp. 681]|jgi:hypothetical protein|uniref:Uncharacterized protein n=1 Tax=Pseudomonas fungipugnans TaxID=3024217 RepID=A0ABT6QWS4_9PSED|nr:hypothetical protein [Pseudomonas sp. 681]MDI2595362.1 hypothetical protein [Pseudomonas sp. 681]